MRRLGALIAVALLAGCGLLPGDPYPMPSAPSGEVGIPASVGTTVNTTILYLTPRPGDEIELVSAEAVGLRGGVSAVFYYSPPVMHGSDRVIGEKLEPVAGARFTNEGEESSADSTVGVVAELTASRPGRYELASVRLTYRINGGAATTGEGISVLFAVCADDPKPADCEPPA